MVLGSPEMALKTCKKEIMKIKKILIIRFSSLGDVILTHPVITKLHKQGYRVDICTKNIYSAIFQNNPQINRIIILENHKNLFHLINVIRKNHYYKIIDLHNNLRSIIIKLFFPFKTITYNKCRFNRSLFLKFKINLLKKNSVTDNYLNTLKKLNIPIVNSDKKYSIPFKPSLIVNRIKKKKIITMAPFAKYYTKEWVYYSELINILSKKYHICIIGEESQYKRADKFHKINNLCGKLDYNGIIHLINLSKLVITNDSGIMHMAAGTDTPIISIFGSTVKEFGFVPERNKITIIENKGLNCRPCHYHGRNSCPKQHFKCMKKISVQSVLSGINYF